jgi:hypothetical protein
MEKKLNNSKKWLEIGVTCVILGFVGLVSLISLGCSSSKQSKIVERDLNACFDNQALISKTQIEIKENLNKIVERLNKLEKNHGN